MIKKGVNILLVLVICSSSYAQNIPNGDFETWNTETSNHVGLWTEAGDISREASAHEGDYAVTLKNKGSGAGSTSSFLASGPFDGQSIESFPYDEKPLSMRFWAKYDLPIGDKAQVAVLFSLKGNFIATTSFTIEGQSDTFRYFSVPITWQVSTRPDSVAIVFSSIELDSNRANGDGYITIDDFHFASISTRNKPVPNGDFETWTAKTVEKIDFWFTTDKFLEQFTAEPQQPPFVKKSTNANTGMFAIEMTNTTFEGDLLPGVIFTGTDPEVIEKPAFGVDQKWRYIEGYYKFTSANNDTAQIGVFMFKNGAPIGGVQALILTEETEFTYFALELTYLINIVPDSASIFIAAGNPENPRGEGSYLAIDDLSFTNQNLGVFDLGANKLTVYPNPFKDEIKISGIDRLEGAEYVVMDATGRVFRQGEVVPNMTIDMRDAGSGIYYLQIEGRYIQTNKILLKE